MRCTKNMSRGRLPTTVPSLVMTACLAWGCDAQESHDPPREGAIGSGFEGRLVIGSDAGAAMLMLRSRLALAPDGMVYAAPTYDPSSVAVFSAQGRFVRTVGRPGLGPGELQDEVVAHAVSPAGDIYVADIGQRVSVFTEAGAFLRSFRLPLPGPIAEIRFMGSELMTQVGFDLDPTNPNPILIADESGQLIRQIRLERGRALFDPSAGGFVWVALRSTDLIRRYDPGGRAVDSLILVAPEGVEGSTSDGPRIMDLVEDETGILWVLAYLDRPTPDLLSGAQVTGPVAEGGEREIVVVSPETTSEFERVRYWNERWTQVLYAFDGASGTLLLSRVYESAYLHQLLSDGTVVVLEDGELGRIHARTIRVNVER